MKNRNIIIIIAAALLVVLLFVLMLSGGSGSTTSRTKKFDWDESYRKAKVQPYEVSWFYKLLNSYSPGKKVTSMDKRAREALPVSAGARGDIYAFVGPVSVIIEGRRYPRKVCRKRRTGIHLFQSYSL